MKKRAMMFALAAMLGQSTASAASAANDWNRDYTSQIGTNHGGAAVRSAGMGVQIGVTIRLGPQRGVRNGERMQLNVSAGPARTVISASDMRAQTSVVPLARFTLKPGYGADVSLANFKLANHRTVLGAADDAAQDKAGDAKKGGDGGKGGGPSTLGWVAIGVGGLVVAFAAASAICADTNCLNSE